MLEIKDNRIQEYALEVKPTGALFFRWEYEIMQKMPYSNGKTYWNKLGNRYMGILVDPFKGVGRTEASATRAGERKIKRLLKMHAKQEAIEKGTKTVEFN